MDTGYSRTWPSLPLLKGHTRTATVGTTVPATDTTTTPAPPAASTITPLLHQTSLRHGRCKRSCRNLEIRVIPELHTLLTPLLATPDGRLDKPATTVTRRTCSYTSCALVRLRSSPQPAHCAATRTHRPAHSSTLAIPTPDDQLLRPPTPCPLHPSHLHLRRLLHPPPTSGQHVPPAGSPSQPPAQRSSAP